MNRTLVFLVLWFLQTGLLMAQPTITTADTPVAVDFDRTVIGVNNGVFAAPDTFLRPHPHTGELDGRGIQLSNLRGDDFSWSDSLSAMTGGRGDSPGGVLSGGVYAFEVTPGNYALGWQPDGDNYTPGAMILRVINNAGVAFVRLRLSYRLYLLNDRDRSQRVNLQYSYNGTNWIRVATALVLTDVLRDENPVWEASDISANIEGVLIEPGQPVYLKWVLDDDTGSGSRDEIAIDDIRVRGYPPAAFQGFEGNASDTWNVIAGYGGRDTITGISDNPPRSRIAHGNYAWQINGESDTLITEAVDLVGYTRVQTGMRLGSTARNGTGNGVEGTDSVKVWVAFEESDFNRSPDLVITGHASGTNARWSYNGSYARAATIAGTPLSVSPEGGGDRDDDGDGISVLTIDIPPGYPQLWMQVTARNNHPDEVWVIDDLYAVGETCPCSGPGVMTVQVSRIAHDQACISFAPRSEYGALVLMKAREPVSAYPVCGEGYISDSIFGVGEELLPGRGDYAVYCGTDTAFVVAGLEPNTTYHFAIFPMGNNACYVTPGYESAFRTYAVENKCIEQGFDHGITVPGGWQFTGITGSYSTQGNYGKAPPAIRMDHSGDRLETPILSGIPVGMQYWIRGQGHAASSLHIEGSTDGLQWDTVSVVTDLPTAGGDGFVRTLGGGSGIVNYDRFRFTFEKETGQNLAIDDISIVCADSGGQTYSWTGEAGTTAFDAPQNWSPFRYGSGKNDVLNFNGGGNQQVTNVPAVGVGQLHIDDTTSLTLYAETGGSDLLIHGASSDTTQFTVCPACTLSIAGADPLRIHLSEAVEGSVAGVLQLSGSMAHQLRTSESQALRFRKGSKMYQLGSDPQMGNCAPFGADPWLHETVVFQSGAAYHMGSADGQSPFGMEVHRGAVVIFEPGSTYFQKVINTGPGETPDTDGRVYGNFVVDVDGTVTTTPSSNQQAWQVDSLCIRNGSLKVQNDYRVEVGGSLHLNVETTLQLNPDPGNGMLVFTSPGGSLHGEGTILFEKEMPVQVAAGATITIDQPVVFPGGVTTDSGAVLNISPGQGVTLRGEMRNDGLVRVKNRGALVQDMGSTWNGQGTVIVESARPQEQETGVVNYWSVPVSGDPMPTVGPTGDLAGDGRVFYYAGGEDDDQDFKPILTNRPMKTGRGYAAIDNLVATFTGDAPNNGMLKYKYGSDREADEDSDSLAFYLVGNPYPSGLSAFSFLKENAADHERIQGTLYLFSQTGNLGELHRGADNIAVNLLGASEPPGEKTSREWEVADSSDFIIAATQGFFIQDNPADDQNTVVFDNYMRHLDNSRFKAGAGRVFLRCWLVLEDGNTYRSTLLGLVQDATPGYDRLYDAPIAFADTMDIWTESGGTKYEIQGLPPAQGQSIYVPIGIGVPGSGEYRLRLAGLWGWPTEQPLYLYDDRRKHMHDLKKEEYRFSCPGQGGGEPPFFPGFSRRTDGLRSGF